MRSGECAQNMKPSECANSGRKRAGFDHCSAIKEMVMLESQVKTDIILKALAETDDLAALRAEKRALALEEKKLRAMKDLEKAFVDWGWHWLSSMMAGWKQND